MYKKRRKSSWPSRLLAAGLWLGGSGMTTWVFADDCGDPGAPASVTAFPFSMQCAIETGSDEDWFQFEAQPGSIYTISATGVGKNVDIALQLYGSDGRTKVPWKNSDDNLEGGQESLSHSDKTGGIFQIQIFQMGFFGSDTGYQLTITESAPQAKELKVITGDTQSIKAGETPTAITFQLLDTNGNGMKRQTIKFALSPDSPSVTLPKTDDQTDENGNVVLQLPALTASGDYVITATFSLPDGSKKEATAKVTVSSGELASLTLTANEDCQSPHSADATCTLKVEGKDGSGNSVPVEQITLNLNSTPKEVKVTNGVTEDLQLTTTGVYAIQATPITSNVVNVTVVAGTPSALEKQSSSTCQDSQPVNSPCDLVFKLVDKKGNAIGGETVNFILTPSDGTTLTNPVVSDPTSGEVKTTLTPVATLTASQSYTISATLGSTTLLNPAVTVNVVVANNTTYSLTVIEGGNQSVVKHQPSRPILFQLTQTTDESGEPVIVTTPMEVTLTLTNPLDPDEKVSLSSYDENGKKVDGDGQITGKTDDKGHAKVEVSFANQTGVTGVTTYLLSAQLKDNSNVADYTNVFLLKEPLDKLLKTWPSLETVNEEGTVSTGGDSKGFAVDAQGMAVENLVTSFRGGLSLKDKNEFRQKPEKIKLTKDKDGKPIKDGKDKSDLVMAQGVIQVDRAHIGQPAEIVIFGENDSPTALDYADGCYMLGSSATMDLQTLGKTEVCQRFREGKMTKEDMTNLIPFRRGVTLTENVLVEMYTGTFYFGADSLRIYFGYRLADGTLVYNGGNPIYITIEEATPAPEGEEQSDPSTSTVTPPATGGSTEDNKP